MLQCSRFNYIIQTANIINICYSIQDSTISFKQLLVYTYVIVFKIQNSIQTANIIYICYSIQDSTISFKQLILYTYGIVFKIQLYYSNSEQYIHMLQYSRFNYIIQTANSLQICYSVQDSTISFKQLIVYTYVIVFKIQLYHSNS